MSIQPLFRFGNALVMSAGHQVRPPLAHGRPSMRSPVAPLTPRPPLSSLLSPQVNMQNMSLAKAQKKTALKSCALAHGLAAGLMTKQMLDNDFKKPIGIASVAMQAGLGLACAIRSVGDDDE